MILRELADRLIDFESFRVGLVERIETQDQGEPFRNEPRCRRGVRRLDHPIGGAGDEIMRLEKPVNARF